MDSYYKCDYLKVNNEFNKKLKDKINKDPFLCGKSDDIEAEFKEKILKEILGFSTEISFKTISDLLVVNKNIANEMVLDLIKKVLLMLSLMILMKLLLWLRLILLMIY